MNPATTLTFYRLGKVERWDAIFYIFSQFVRGVLVALVAFLVLGQPLSDRNVNFAIRRPGMRGTRYPPRGIRGRLTPGHVFWPDQSHQYMIGGYDPEARH